MKKSVKIIIIIIVAVIFILPLIVALLGSFLVPKLLSNVSDKACCNEIGGTISGKYCIFEDLNGKELSVQLDKLENSNGINYCTDEYFDRDTKGIR